MKYRNLAILVAVIVFTLAAGLRFERISAQDSKDDETDIDRQRFMRGKLKMVNKIVEGISTEEFDLVEEGALELAALSESATWKSTKDPFYGHYSSNFEHAVRGLLAAAKSESIEKATFAYVHVTISCTACHQHVRGTKRVAAAAPSNARQFRR